MSGESDRFAPIDLQPESWMRMPQPYVQLRICSMGSYVEVRVDVDARIVATGVGSTLGEALMVAGALMTGTQVIPMHKRALRFLRRLR